MHRRFLFLFFLLFAVSAAPHYAEAQDAASVRDAAQRLVKTRHADNTLAAHRAFFIAAERGNLEALEALIEAGIDVNLNYGEALNLAATHGHTQAVALLLKAGADPTANNGTAAELAAVLGHEEAAALLRQAAENTKSTGTDQ